MRPGHTAGVRTRTEIPTALLEVAAQQRRVITVAQARRFGLSDRVVERLVRDGTWRRLDRGLLLVTNSPPSISAYVAAGLLLIPGGFVSGRTALALHGLDDVRLPIEIAHASVNRLTTRTWLTPRRTAYNPAAATRINGFDVLGIIDSLVTACHSLPRTAAADAFLRAVALRKADAGALTDAVCAVPNLPHRATLLDVLADATDGLHSRLEIAHDRDVLRPHGLPRPKTQFVLPTGRIADLCYPEYRVIVELDGETHRSSTIRDRTRDNKHSLTGWVTLRFGWDDVLRDPCGVAADLVTALVGAGWTGLPQECARCAAAA